ncbi:MAG: PAS domain-containing protein, partial [bacterium]
MKQQNINEDLVNSFKANDNSLLNNLLKNTNTSIFQQDQKLKFTNILNPPLKLKREYFINRTDYDLLPADEAQNISRIKEYVLATSQLFKGNLQLSFNGKKKTYNISIEPVLAVDNNIIGIISFLIDISNLVKSISNKTKLILFKDNEQLSLVLQGAQLGFWDQSFVTGIVFRSDQFYKMIGYSREEISCEVKAFENLIHPDDLPVIKDSAKILREGSSDIFDVEQRVKAKNGEWIWINNCGTIVERADDGKPIRALGIYRDITKRKNYEKLLKDKSLELDYLYSCSPVGLALVDKNLRYLRINDTLAKISDTNVEDHIGKTIDEILPLKLASIIIPLLKKVLKERKAILGLDLNEEIGGNKKILRDWLVSYYPVESSEGNLVGIGIVLQDITEIKKTKDDLEKLNNELMQERVDLQSKNIALREVMNQVEDEKKKIAHNVQINIDKSIKPMLERLEKQLAKKEKAYLANIQRELEQLTSPYLNKLTSAYSDMSPRDIEICNFIKNGYLSKEIAGYLNVSEEAIRSRRKIIRKKL